MLQRVISIRNVGRFRSAAAAGDVSFRRVTLVLAENGRGKTTFCAIMRSLSKNDPRIVQGRATLGAAEPPHIELRVGAGTVSYRNGAWSSHFDKIAVFDGTFVSENVFAGEIVDTEQRRNLYASSSVHAV